MLELVLEGLVLLVVLRSHQALVGWRLGAGGAHLAAAHFVVEGSAGAHALAGHDGGEALVAWKRLILDVGVLLLLVLLLAFLDDVLGNALPARATLLIQRLIVLESHVEAVHLLRLPMLQSSHGRGRIVIQIISRVFVRRRVTHP